MNNGKIFLTLALLSAVLLGCQKESALSNDLNSNSQPYVKTVLRFTVGEKTYELSSVRQETSYQTSSGCAGNGCGDANAKDFTDNWTCFSAGNLLTVIRQDNAEKPGFRLSLNGTVDLNKTALPVTVADASITLNDFNGALAQATDDPAYQSGALSFEGTQDAVQLTVHSRQGNVVEGTFSGTLSMSNGAAIEISSGTFTAQLKGL